jgi:hypothetical protein
MTVNPNQPIHPDLHERISVKIQGQLPRFVKEDHETFISFMEAYYEYMEQLGKPYEIIGNLTNYANIDKTVDEFLNYFKKQFGEDIPEAVFQNANKPFVLKHLRDFYRTKGSEKSFQFLFRLLYKEEIRIDTPKGSILRTSDGKFDSSYVIRTMDISSDFFKLEGQRVKGQTSGATAIIESVVVEILGSFCVSTMFLSEVFGVFVADEIVTDGIRSFSIGNIIIDYSITNPGTGYNVNDVIPLSGAAKSSGALIRIKEITSGSLFSVSIESGGTGYKVGDKLDIDNTNKLSMDGRTVSLLVSSVDNNGSIVKLFIENNGSGYLAVPTISGGSGVGASISFGLTDTGIGGVKTLEIINSGFGYNAVPDLDFSGLGDGTAEAVLDIGGFDTTPISRFINSDGFLSANKYLQDSFFYQLFSYEITSTQNIQNWRDIVKRLIHPAGLALFGKIQIITSVSAPLSISNVIPDTTDRYTIIFHDGIEPPHILDLTLETCNDTQDVRISEDGDDYGGFDLLPSILDYQPSPNDLSTTFSSEEDFQPTGETLSSSVSSEESLGLIIEGAFTVAPAIAGCPGDANFPFTNIKGLCSPTDFGLITDEDISSGVLNLESEMYGRVRDANFHFLPTKCQVVEQDLWVQKLTEGDGFDDYAFTDDAPGSWTGRPDTLEDYGAVNEAPTVKKEDYGEATFHNTFFGTQLKLGPILRTQHRTIFQSRFRTLENSGGVDHIELFDGGSGFEVIPTVTVEAPLEGGVNATATAIFERIVIPEIQSGFGDDTTNPIELIQDVTDISHIVVSINGLIQAPNIDYTLNSKVLTFDEVVVSGDLVVVYYLNINRESNVQVGVGNGSTSPLVLTQDAGTGDPASESILVIINGVVQRPNVDYVVSGTGLFFGEIVPLGDTIVIYYLGLQLTNTQRSSGDGTTNPLVLSQSVNNIGNIIVSINGLIQLPNVDYIVDGTSLTFDEVVLTTDNVLVHLLDPTPRVHPDFDSIISIRVDIIGTGYEIDVPTVTISPSESGVVAIATAVLQRGSCYSPISYRGNEYPATFMYLRGNKTNRCVDPIITQYSLIEDPNNAGVFFETTPPEVL